MFIEGKDVSDVVLYEAPCGYSRDVLPIAANVAVVPGTLLELSGTSYVVCTTAANAAAVAVASVTAPADATALCPAITRHAVVGANGLAYGALDKAAVNAALLALGIVVRSGPTFTEQTT